MSEFTTQLYTRVLPREELVGTTRQLYQLTAPLVYESDLLGIITAPQGLLTDFASIPRLAWRYLDPEDPAILYPSVIHDALYSYSGRLPGSRPCTRALADAVLREAMVACGARADQRAVVYRLVRLCGGSRWQE